MVVLGLQMTIKMSTIILQEELVVETVVLAVLLDLAPLDQVRMPFFVCS